MNQSQKMLV